MELVMIPTFIFYRFLIEIMMRYFIVILTILALCSCDNIKHRKEQALSVMEQWIGKEIVYPDNLNFTILGVDTLYNEIQSQYLFKVVSYVDSTGCTSCKLQLPRWKAFIAEMDSASRGRSVVSFILHSNNVSDIIYTLKYNNYKYPVCIDEKKSFYNVNNLPLNEAFQTFLLDENNRVIAIGNPIHNPKIKDLFLKIIGEEKVEQKDKSKVVTTKVDIDKTSVSLGNFDWQKEQKATFVLKNAGNKPLVIEDVNTSCGCTSVDYSKEPVRPNEEIRLEVIYKADHPEHFNKTITVYCNSESSPIELTISGNAQ